ncbi:hypothetical protein EG329_009638 [Mollisiaceae sp. DMI_Dod_QoI]|nr:hypothetical protein EG329_009638 [Helotiales sp. DMI_Dod_QoI]
MIRSGIKSKALANGALKAAKRSFSTQDWEGIHGYTGDTKLPFTWRPQAEPSNIQQTTTPVKEVKKPVTPITQGKSMKEKDEDLKLKLEGISGEGGEAGLELENGKPVGLKRGVKENMFRII